MSILLDELTRRVDEAMLRDRSRLRRAIRSLRRRNTQPDGDDDAWRNVRRMLDASCDMVRWRREHLPVPTLVPDLPIAAHQDEITEAIKLHPVVIVCGETGSGKSTQLPKICLATGRGVRGVIGHTQPRRIAARSIAARVADELKTPLGESVGYKIRFHDQVSDKTFVKLMTDGILLAESHRDRMLEQYDTLILDEAHERSLNIDFLLGFLHTLLDRRRDLRVIITSATMDAARFANHFAIGGNVAPVIEVSGRSYPVEIDWQPIDRATPDDDEEMVAIADAIERLLQTHEGDILVFLPTEHAIRHAARFLRGRTMRRTELVDILPLYARLSDADQQRVFRTSSRRRVILATNVAESSLTVPGIRSVVDTGTARIARYSPKSQIERMPIEPISQASADQRAGRCGREGPGCCIRLYSEGDYLQRDRFGTPEIRRTNLAAVILRMLALRLGEVDQFPFLDPPRIDAVRDGYRTLAELQAIDNQGNLTELGRRMSEFPVDPRIARMILAGESYHSLHEVLIVAAALEVSDPRLRPAQQEMEADQQHEPFQHDDSDFFGYLSLWDHVHQLRGDLSRSAFDRALRRRFLSRAYVWEWMDVFRQLRRVVTDRGLPVNSRRDDYADVHRALLTGLVPRVAVRRTKSEYDAATGGVVYLWPGAGPFASRPQWVMAAECVETSRRFFRAVARVEPEWIEEVAEHLVTREYSNPVWSRRAGTVVARERVELANVTLASRRSLRYGKIDPGTARHLFLQHALVEGRLRGRFAFLQHNLALVQSLAKLAARSRNRNLVVSNAIQYAYYDERIPDEVFDMHSLRRWLRTGPHQVVNSLHMSRDDLLPGVAETEGDLQQYPMHLEVGGHCLDVEYQFDPERDDDGLSITVDRDTLARLDGGQLEWMVPGLLAEKIVALIRTLPKSLRRNLIPAPEVARKAVAMITFGDGPCLPTVAAALSDLAGVTISQGEFRLRSLPHHLRILVRVVDDEQRVMASGRDLDALRKRLDVTPAIEQHVVVDAWHQDDVQPAAFPDLPDSVDVPRTGGIMQGFPALVDLGASVALRLYNQRSLARHYHRHGLRRLCVQLADVRLREQVAWIPNVDRWARDYRRLSPEVDLAPELIDRLADAAYLMPCRGDLPRSRAAFDAMCRAGEPRIPEVVQDMVQVLEPLFASLRNVIDRSTELPTRWNDIGREIITHLRLLLAPPSLATVAWEHLVEFPRYVQATELRLDRLRGGGAARDRRLSSDWWHWMERYRQRSAQHRDRAVSDEELDTFRWMLEEYRISLFAQELGTRLKVSPQRLEKQWSRVQF